MSPEQDQRNQLVGGLEEAGGELRVSPDEVFLTLLDCRKQNTTLICTDSFNHRRQFLVSLRHFPGFTARIAEHVRSEKTRRKVAVV